MNNSTEFNIKFIVRVHCTTYNHAPYIVDAMNGFCIQKTDFPFVCTFFDDASTDGEQEVIHNYLQDHFDLEDKFFVRNEETDDYLYTFARHKTNHNCFFAIYYLKYNHYSIKKTKAPYLKDWAHTVKYIAICEGDDYWTDSKKLQTQYDFMRSHPNYSMIYHPVLYDTMGKLEKKKTMIRYERDVNTYDVIEGGGGFIPTCSIFCKKEVSAEQPEFRLVANVGDYPLQIFFTLKGKVHYIPNIMGVYRRFTQNSWTKRTKENRLERNEKMEYWMSSLNRFTNQKYHSIINYILLLEYYALFKEGIIQYSYFIKKKNSLPISILKLKRRNAIQYFKIVAYTFYQRITK